MSYSNSEVAHMWAHQKRLRASGSNFFFDGVSIYSYGSHYRCGIIVRNRKGQVMYVINSTPYSSSTSRHVNEAVWAIPNNQRIAYSENCVTPVCIEGKNSGYKSAIYMILNKLYEIKQLFDKQSRARISDYSECIFSKCMEIRRWVEFWELDKSQKWRENRKFQMKKSVYALFNGSSKSMAELDDMYKAFYYWRDLGIEKIKNIPELISIWKALGSIEAKFDEDNVRDCVASYFNSDEVLQRMEAQKKEAQALKIIKAQRKRANIQESLDLLKKWHNDECSQWHPTDDFIQKFHWHTALRISYRNKTIETSKGIRLTYQEAQRLWKLVKAFHDGQQFHHDLAIDLSGNKWAFNSYEDDILTAGCHKIHFTECQRIAGLLGFGSK